MSHSGNAPETVVETCVEIKDVECRTLKVSSKLTVGSFLELYLPGPGLLWTPTIVKLSAHTRPFEERWRGRTLDELLKEMQLLAGAVVALHAPIEFCDLRFAAERTGCDDGGVGAREWGATWNNTDNSAAQAIQGRVDRQMLQAVIGGK
jgi:hypothetical protein